MDHCEITCVYYGEPVFIGEKSQLLATEGLGDDLSRIRISAECIATCYFSYIKLFQEGSKEFTSL